MKKRLLAGGLLAGALSLASVPSFAAYTPATDITAVQTAVTSNIEAVAPAIAAAIAVGVGIKVAMSWMKRIRA